MNMLLEMWPIYSFMGIFSVASILWLILMIVVAIRANLEVTGFISLLMCLVFFMDGHWDKQVKNGYYANESITSFIPVSNVHLNEEGCMVMNMKEGDKGPIKYLPATYRPQIDAFLKDDNAPPLDSDLFYIIDDYRVFPASSVKHAQGTGGWSQWWFSTSFIYISMFFAILMPVEVVLVRVLGR